MKKKEKIWTEETLEILYECWKNIESEKELAFCISEKLPKIHPIAALSMVRKLLKTDKKWMQMATRKKNQKEKIKLEKLKEKENKLKLKEEKKIVREESKKVKEKKLIESKIRENIKEKLDQSYTEEINKHIKDIFFFCNDVQQYVPTISCIFRVFGSEVFSYCSECEKCKHMEKYSPSLREIINVRESISKQKEFGRDQASTGGSKVKKERTGSKERGEE